MYKHISEPKLISDMLPQRQLQLANVFYILHNILSLYSTEHFELEVTHIKL